MTETGTVDRPSVAKPVSRPRSRKPATVSATALALHLDCSRTYIGKLEASAPITPATLLAKSSCAPGAWSMLSRPPRAVRRSS